MKYYKVLTLSVTGLLAILFICCSVSRIKAIQNPLSVYSFKENITDNYNASKTEKLRIASYNIAHGRGGKYGAKNWSHKTEKGLLEHLDKIVKQITLENPDIIVLNEVDFSSFWSFNVNQAEYIGKKCRYAYVLEQKNMVVRIPFYRLSFGNALLSKYPIKNESFIKFQPYSGIEDIFAGSHDAFYCEVELPHKTVLIFGIHFEYRSEDIRVQSAEYIAEMCSEKIYPVIALGDFNSTPIGLPHSEITESGKNAMTFLIQDKGFIPFLSDKANKDIYSFPSEKPVKLIDWIIGKGIRNFSNSKIINSDLSDHLMIVTEISFES